MIRAIAQLGPGTVLETARFMALVVVACAAGAEGALRLGAWWDDIREVRFQRDLYQLAAETFKAANERITGELDRIETARRRHFTDPAVAWRAYRAAARR